MLEFTGGSLLPALQLLVVHDDAEREFDYVAGAEKVIIAAQTKGWTMISMKDDFKVILHD